MVRLEGDAERKTDVEVAHFNSSMVRLEDTVCLKWDELPEYFNSSMVRLEVLTSNYIST